MMMVKSVNLGNKVQLYIYIFIEFFEEKLIPISKSGTFIYEAPEGKSEKRAAGKNREDTRSLFDDPKL